MFALFSDTGAGTYLSTAFISMLPVVELRGSIPFGISAGLTPLEAYWTSVAGNMFPVAFLILLVRKIFELMKKHYKFSKTIDALEAKAYLKSRFVTKYRLWGLCLLVAVPLPGTGAWTGALVASLLDIRLKNAFPAILAGVLISGLLVTLTTCGIFTFFRP